MNPFTFAISLLLGIALNTTEINLVYTQKIPFVELPSIEKQFQDMGYRPFSEAVKEFESKNQVKVKLPEKFPFQITHKFGRIHEGSSNLDLYYYNQQTREMAKIHVSADDLTIQKPTANQILIAKDQTEIIYRPHTGNINATLIEFIKDDLRYVVFISPRNSKKKEVTKNDVIHLVESTK